MSAADPLPADVPPDASGSLAPGESGALTFPLALAPESDATQPHDPAPGRFLAELGGELRVPMNRMMSLARLMLDAGLPPAQQRVARQICDSADSLLTLLNDAFDFANPGALEAAAIDFDLRLLVNEMAERLRVRAGEKNVSLEHRVHHEVPSRLIGDAGRLRQVIWNLGAHAIDTIHAGGLVLRVGRVHEDRDSVTVRFDLRSYLTSEMGGADDDWAAGREDSAPEAAAIPDSCSSLQLSIARRLAGFIGGALHAEGQPGSTGRAWFDLTFRKQVELPAEDDSIPFREGLSGTRVLIVDPKVALRGSLVAKLESWGCRTSDVTLAEDAHALVREASEANDPFRFVLIDRDQPMTSGEELGTALRAEATGTAPQMIMLAAVGCRGDMERARSCGFSAYLSKPIDWQDLADAMIEIPHLAARAPADVERPLVTRHWLAETRRSRTRILVVEDDIVSALVTDWTLRRMGYQVQRVSSAAEMRQLSARTSKSFDLVVLALRLPDADGLSLVEELRGTAPGGRRTAIMAIGYDLLFAR